MLVWWCMYWLVCMVVIVSSVDELIVGLGEVVDGDIVYQFVVGQDDCGLVWLFFG